MFISFFSIWVILQTPVQFAHVCSWFILLFSLKCYFPIPSGVLSYISEVNAIRKHTCLVPTISFLQLPHFSALLHIWISRRVIYVHCSLLLHLPFILEVSAQRTGITTWFPIQWTLLSSIHAILQQYFSVGKYCLCLKIISFLGV